MIKRIVTWEFLPEARGHTRQENMDTARAMLEALPGQIPQIVSLNVYPAAPGEAYHMALELTARTLEDIDAYKNHPAHRAVSAYIGAVRGERVAFNVIVGQ